jgi:hypothetical protein
VIFHETYIDAVAIVCDLKQLQAPVFDHYFERCRAGINGILDKFFESMHRCYDDLASSDLVHNIRIKCLN